MSEVTQTGGGGQYFGPTQMGPLFDKSQKRGNKELVERDRSRPGACPIHQANAGWNLGTVDAVNVRNVDGDNRTICPICGTQALLKAGTY